jgi:DNA-binding transcriptional LysR family regulator
MRTIDLESLKIFRTVVDEGGVVRAANKLNRVQSNVTTRIRQLEEHLGTRLFRREGRSIRLSAEGHTLLTYADRLLRLADETVSEMRTGKPKGVFRLGSIESTAGSRLAPILSRYHSVYPDVVVELATGTTGALVTRVVNFELEAAFVSCDIQGDLQGVRPSRPRTLNAHRVRAGVLLSQAHRGMARQRECDARTDHGICLVSGDDRLRRCRYRICRGAQVRPGGPARDQECAPTRAP